MFTPAYRTLERQGDQLSEGTLRSSPVPPVGCYSQRA
jgi:hypothetical protein